MIIYIASEHSTKDKERDILVYNGKVLSLPQRPFTRINIWIIRIIIIPFIIAPSY